jgi:hypothetical protein
VGGKVPLAADLAFTLARQGSDRGRTVGSDLAFSDGAVDGDPFFCRDIEVVEYVVRDVDETVNADVGEAYLALYRDILISSCRYWSGGSA